LRTCLFSLAIFVSALPLVAQSKHPFTFEDMMALKRVEEPEVSPDGKWVLFAAVDVDLKANTKTPHVWVVPLSSGDDSHVSQKQGDMGHPSSSLGMTESREKEIISDQDADRPRWAPGGKRFAFVSKKENGSQIWIADFDGVSGSVTGKHRLTNIATEANGELWSPDGKNILFESDVYPECDGTPVAEAQCNAKKLEEVKNSKVKALIFTHLLYRHWNAYKEGKRTHLFVVPADLGALGMNHRALYPVINDGYDLTPGDYDAPVFSLGGEDDYSFSPDGQEICYASNHDPEPAISTNNDLFTVSVNFQANATSKDVLAATKDITADNKAADNTPLYSPDGKYIAYRAQQRPGYESDRWRLMLYDRKTGEKRVVKPGQAQQIDFDYGIDSFVWSPESSRIHFVAEQQGLAEIFTVAPKFRPEERGDYLSSMVDHPDLIPDVSGYDDDLAAFPDRSPDGGFVYTKMNVERPSEIYVRSRNQAAALTHVNDVVLSRVSMSPLETFWFTGAHADKVQGWIIKPPNFDPNKKYPVKFIIHGGPEVPMGDEWSYRWNFELFVANGYVVVFINFHGSPGYGQEFIDAINGDWGGAPFEDLMKGLDFAEQHYPFIDKDRECALGASYGGYMANWILGHTNRFKCIVTHDGMFNTESAWGDTEELWFNEWEFKGTPYTNREMYRKWSPHLFATNFKTPTLVIHSQLDYRLDVSQGFDLFTTLQREGVPSKMLYFPDEGHWVLKPQNSQLWYKTVNDWVDQWVGKKD
jgi:dipeptidyl aminopeptidase/acylaminoacyl peptidase